MKLPSLLIALLTLLVPVAHAEWLAVADDKGAVYLLDGSNRPVLRFWYYDWGPEWSGVQRGFSAEEQNGRQVFTRKHTIKKTDTPFTIEGAWQSLGENGLGFEAVLEAQSDSGITMSTFILDSKAMLEGTEALLTTAEGETFTVPVPFPARSINREISSMELTTTDGRQLRIRFDEPTMVRTDRGDARFILAESSIAPGAPDRLAFTIETPEALAFIPGPVAGAKHPSADISGWYVFDAPVPIPAESAWQMRDWIEAPAGKHGRIVREGERLYYNGKPIKLWGLNNSYAACAPGTELADKRADFYAAMGVNSVRLHKYADGTGWAGILAEDSMIEYDPAKLDQMDYYVNALKERGIFVKLSPVFIADIGRADLDRIPYAEELGKWRNHRIDPNHGSLFLSRELQDLLIDQTRVLMAHRNPHTGLTYAEDPAIAFFEMYNEDSALFFGTLAVLKKSPTLRARAGELFANWLQDKYGSKEALAEAWGEKGGLNSRLVGGNGLPTDESWSERRIYPIGNPWFYDPTNLMGSQRRYQRRLLDTMAFLFDLQNDFYARYAEAIRETGYEGEIIASNWQAGRMMSHFYNLYTDSLYGTIDRHNYHGGGPRGGLGLFNSTAMVAKPGSSMLSSSLQQVDDCAFMLSEWIHVLPSEWHVEGPAILGAYGMGLQGWDVSYPFQNADSGTFASQLKQPWEVTAPHFLGIFPAVSRQVLRGDVKESEVVHYRNVHLPSLDEMKVGFEGKTVQDWDVKSFTSDVFPQEALAVARGVVRFTEEFMPTEKFDLASHMEDGAYASTTGQLSWHPGESAHDGYFTVDSAGTQGICGFFEGVEAKLQNAVIRTQSRFGAIYLTALSEGGTVADDDHILISAIARARNKGAVVVADTIALDRGIARGWKGRGVRMEPVVAEIQLKGIGNATVHLLDHGGIPTGETVPLTDGRFQIDTGRHKTPYYLIQLD